MSTWFNLNESTLTGKLVKFLTKAESFVILLNRLLHGNSHQSAHLWVPQARQVHFRKFCITNIFLKLRSNFSTWSSHTLFQIFPLVPLKLYQINLTYLLKERASNMSHVINLFSPHPFHIYKNHLLQVKYSSFCQCFFIWCKLRSVLCSANGLGLGLLVFAFDRLWIQNVWLRVVFCFCI